VVAALSAVAALSWTAAEGGRGLDWSDFRTVVIVALAVLVAAVAVARRSPDSR
jgi:Na+/proline symporter